MVKIILVSFLVKSMQAGDGCAVSHCCGSQSSPIIVVIAIEITVMVTVATIDLIIMGKQMQELGGGVG